MSCGLGALLNSSHEAVQVKPALCGRWSCETCAPVRRMNCEIEIRSGVPDAVLTITIHNNGKITPLEAREAIAMGFPRFIRWLRQQTGSQIEYFAVCERHKSGFPHVHVALRGWKYLHQTLLSEQWRRLTGSSIVDIRRKLQSGEPARYLAKYLGKDLTKFGAYKRYWKSKGWLIAVPEKTAEIWRAEGWRWTRDNPDEVARLVQRCGWRAVPGEGPRGVRVFVRAPWWRADEAPMPFEYSASGSANATAPPEQRRRAA